MNKIRFIKLFTYRGMRIKMHWSLTLIVILGLLGGLLDISVPVGTLSFLLVLFIHELGHVWFAARFGLKTLKIELYPFDGRCYHQSPDTPYPNYVIPWGGVVAQVIVAIPCIAIHYFYSDGMRWRFELPLIFLGYVNLFIAFINLTPLKFLDGDKCWQLLPLYISFRFRRNKAKKSEQKHRHHRTVSHK